MKRSTGKVAHSKFLSLVLRHQPGIIGLQLDKAGWAEISDLVQKASNAGVQLTYAIVRTIVDTSDKQRFSISSDGLRIRANQGHSIPVELGLQKIEPPEFLFHGTAKRNLVAIRHQGITKGNRQYVHLSADENTALETGRRHGYAVVLTVQTGRMSMDGFAFYRAENGVWLTEHVPAEYFNL